MNALVQAIGELRAKLDGLQKQSLKEIPTRTIVIDPLLVALGWDVRDPEEVELEFPTVDNKSVDYALKINGKPVLLVEAKPLDDALDDVKAITQVVGYAANAGIMSCILTNGVKWRVYRSMEKCPAPEKLMFEVSLDPRESEAMPADKIALQMWRFSKEEMAKGTLDELGERTFTDGKVRKAVDSIMRNPPRSFLNIVRAATGDSTMTPQRVRESILRIAGAERLPTRVRPPTTGLAPLPRGPDEEAPKVSSRRRSRTVPAIYDQSRHTSRKPQEVLRLYEAMDRFCLSLKPGAVEKRFLKWYIAYTHGTSTFCSFHLVRDGMRVWLKLEYEQLSGPPRFARDVSRIGHWGVGNVELRIRSLAELEEAKELIRISFQSSTV